jgi:hypothetical protein
LGPPMVTVRSIAASNTFENVSFTTATIAMEERSAAAEVAPSRGGVRGRMDPKAAARSQ